MTDPQHPPTHSAAKDPPAGAWLDADVCIAGAGFAGLSAALRLHEAGYSVVVVEARDRIGGRSWTIYLPDGTQVDRGGAWFGPGQDAAYALAKKMDCSTYPSWDEGDGIIMDDGKPVRADIGGLERINPLRVVDVALAASELDEMATNVPPDAPWEAAHAAEWDRQTLGAWLAKNIEQDWTAENWTRGAMITHFPPGVLTSFGPALRAPVGALHWAGTDNTAIMRGTLDGAIRSGQRAAEEVIAALSGS